MTDRLEWLAAQLKGLSAQTHGALAMKLLIQEYRAEMTPNRSFRLALVGRYPDAKKIQLIKHTRALTGATLKDTKHQIDTLPIEGQIVTNHNPVHLLTSPQEKCQEAKKVMEAAGGICTLEPV